MPVRPREIPHVEPYDDKEIGAADKIIRRISRQHVIWDDNRGRNRISTKAFRPSSPARGGGMSVDIEALIVKAGKDPRRYVKTPPFTGAVWFAAGKARALGLIVGRHPLEGNPYHGEVWGGAGRRHFSRTQQRELRAASAWYVPIEGVDIDPDP